MAFMTFEDAIADAQSLLNLSLVDFDRWASQNPSQLNYDDQTFRLKKNQIKMLRLKLAKLNAGNSLYKNTPK